MLSELAFADRTGLLLTVLGYCAGSFLASYYLPLWLLHIDITQSPDDHNPGAANAFSAAGIPLGILCLVCDIGKGALPVAAGVRLLGPDSPWLALLLIAPVLGHTFPLFRHGHGGKGIAVSFGVLIGLWPMWNPLWALVFFYLLFSLVLVISPHTVRSILTFGLWALYMVLFSPLRAVRFAAVVLSGAVIYRHARAATGEQVHVRLFKKA